MIRILKNNKGIIEEASFESIKSLDVDWIDCQAPTDRELDLIAKKTNLPRGRLLHYLDEDARPHVLETKTFSLILFAAPILQVHQLRKTTIALFLFGSNNILTLHPKPVVALTRIEHVLKQGNAAFLEDTSHFVYNVLDEIITDYFAFLEQQAEYIDALERNVFLKPDRSQVNKIFESKKNLIYIHRALVANREVIIGIEKGYLSRMKKTALAHFGFLYNDLLQLIDIGETYRDVLTGVLEIYLSSISNNLNHIVKRLTGWGSLILIPTLIASIYGMNFHETTSPYNMPELNWEYGYFFALGFMVVSVVLLYFYFKRKDWI